MSYTEPSWAQPPPPEFQWDLLEIKSGTEVAKYKLSHRCIILGRAADMVHIPLQHESSSRQHARIAFDSQGIPWLRDLKSAHGTTINKRRLPPPAIGKTESNSHQAGARGVMLFPGDILQFGASTRIFCLEGPPEYERGAMKAKTQQAEAKAKETSSSSSSSSEPKLEKPKDDGVSWGISMGEAENENSNQSVEKTLPMDMQVPEKHRKAFERLNALKYKLSNLETEDGRIRRKGELTEGQERQLHRNAEREENLKKSIVDLEEELYDKIYPEKVGARKRRLNSDKQLLDDEDDDFFDRTKEKNDSGIDDEESEKTLVAKWTNLYQQQKHRTEKTLPQAQSHASSLTAKLAKLQVSGDEEAFFVQNDLQLAKESVNKILGEQKKVQETMTEIERLLIIVNPKLNVCRDSGYIGLEDPPKDDDSLAMTMLPPPIRPKPVQKSVEANANAGDLSMPPPSMPPPMARKHIENDDKNHSLMPPPLMPPPKRKRVVGPSMPPPSSSSSAKLTDSLPAPKVASDKKPQGTLAFLATMTKQKAAEGKPRSKPAASKAVSDAKKDEWRAPEGQDGSGVTKLNAKFAGRY